MCATSEGARSRLRRLVERMGSQAEEKATVLIVEDDRALRSGLRWALADDYAVLEAETRHEALEKLEREAVDVVICDLHLPPATESIQEGLVIVEAAKQKRPPVPTVVITGSADKRVALEAVRHGAYGFFEKPFDEDEVLHIVRQAARVRRLEAENLRLRSKLSGQRGFGRLIGSSPALAEVIRQARAVAATDATVLLCGESGTGKELLACAIHEESARASGPFIAVNCAALPETLIESELFGHEKGAFTGATQAKKGRFELADGGTLFLDEIGELSPAVQVKLLRALQERKFERLGGTRTIEVDIRLIAASNRDLDQEVEAGRFRQDLFYRLNVVPLTLPPLRQRREDIPVLAAFFANKAANKHGFQPPELAPELLAVLQTYDWPGNVREMENLMERLVVLTRGAKLGLEYLPEKIKRTVSAVEQIAEPTDATLEEAVQNLKKRMILRALEAEGGNRGAAAKRLGISRSYLHRLINELGITTL